jgi:predicted N-formylglutamate amidohydrolase
MKDLALIISCEHAVNTIPDAYKNLFYAHQQFLDTHRAIDLGSLTIAQVFHKAFDCDFVQTSVTRLLIDCNRSLSHRQCFSELSGALPAEEKAQIIQTYYLPYRQKIESLIKQRIVEGKQVLHLSIHSFTPSLDGLEREVDIGFLYDPKRAFEKNLCARWRQLIKEEDKNLRVYANRPYRGVSDGFTTALRKQFAGKDYAGIEIETNQKLAANPNVLDDVARLYAKTLRSLID